MQKTHRLFLAVLMAGLMGSLCLSGCGEKTDPGAAQTAAAESETETAADKPRLAEDDEEPVSPERALMKANQVQNEGDADIYPIREGKNEKKDYSVFVYMIGSDLEASYGYATRDMQEMEESGIDLTKTNLVVYAGGSRMWKSDIPSDQNNVLDMSLEGEERVVASTHHTSDMGAPETLAAFLDYAVSYYPADHYALIFWDHGGGSIYGYGNDTLYSGDSLLLSELESVMDGSRFGDSGEAHLDWVGFDACLMSTAENAAVWSRYADYMIASEETEPGDGWSYGFLDTLNGEKDAAAIGKAIVDEYKAYYEAKKSPLNNPDITLAVLDLKQMDMLTDSIDALVTELGDDIEDEGFADLVRSRSATKMFGLRGDRATAYDLLDIGDLAVRMKEEHPEAAEAVETALANMIIHSTDAVEGSCGLSLYFPGENRELYEAASASENEHHYISDTFADFAQRYAKKWMTASDVDWQMPQPEVSGGEITLELTKEQADNLDKATYTVLLDQGDGFYRRGLCKVEVVPDENNVLHIPADPSLIYAASDYGTMSVPCAFAQAETRESTAVYDSMRLFFCYGTEMTSSPYDYITASVEEKDGKFVVKSFRYENTAVSAGGKNTVDLSEYVSINEYTSDQVYPKRADDGTMLPYYQWDTQTGTFSAHLLHIDESLRFVGKKLSDSGQEAAVQVILRDINGAEHGSEICRIGQNKADQKADQSSFTSKTAKGTLTFEIHGKEIWLTRYQGEDTELELPQEAGGRKLTRICGGAFNFSDLRELTIPEGVTTLEHDAVSYASSLKALYLPSTLEMVGRAPVQSCDKLESITVNGNGKRVCDKDGVLFSADGKTLISYPAAKGRFYTVPEGTETIGYEAFYEANVYEVEFPETLKNIDNYAFEGCRSLDTITLPESLERIGTGAFSQGFTFGDQEEAAIIETVKLGANVSNIGLEAFSGHPVIAFEVSEENPFYSGVNGMITSKAGDVLVLCPQEIGGSVIVPDGVVGLTAGVFAELPPETAFYFPDSLVRMNLNDFPYRDDDNYDPVYELTIYCSKGSAAETFAVKNDLNYEVTGPEELNLKPYFNETVPGLNGFYRFRVYEDHAVFTSYTGADSSISIPDKVRGVPVTEVGDGEKAIYAPETIDDDAGDDTAEVTNLGRLRSATLRHIEFPKSVTKINDGAFEDTYIEFETLRLPDNLEKLGPKAFGGTYSGTKVTSFEISEENAYFKTKEGVLFTKDGKTLVRFPSRANTDHPALTIEKDGRGRRYVYQVPDGCETIGRFAFANTQLIDAYSSFNIVVDNFEVRLSPETSAVSGYAFCSAYVSAVEMNEGLEVIEEHAFESCKLKTEVLTLPSTVRTLGAHAFETVNRAPEDESSILLYGFSHIELPEELESIGKNAFSTYSGDSLTCDDLVIGRKLKDIEEGAFEGFIVTGFSVDEKNSAYKSAGGCLLSGDGKTLITVPQGYQGSFTVPEGVERIEKYAFYDCDGIRDIHIGKGVTYIHPQAIYIGSDAAMPVIYGVSGSEAEHFALARGYDWRVEK